MPLVRRNHKWEPTKTGSKCACGVRCRYLHVNGDKDRIRRCYERGGGRGGPVVRSIYPGPYTRPYPNGKRPRSKTRR